MDATEIIGICATCLSGIKNIPQLYKIQKDDNVESFSKETLLLALVTSSLWAYYGFKRKSPSMIVGSLAAILYEMYLIYKILKYEKYKKE